MKEKVVAVAMYLCIVAVGMALTPPVYPQQCFFHCVAQHCYYPQGLRGHAGLELINDASGDEVIVGSYVCQGYTGASLYDSCTYYFCGMSGAGALLHMDNGTISIFTIRNKQDRDELLADIQKDGIVKARAAHKASIVSAENFNTWQGKFLALSKDKACSATEGK